MIIRNCSIHNCREKKYIGFIHFKYHTHYNLCMKHYYDQIRSCISIDGYIEMKNKHKGVDTYAPPRDRL